MSRYLPRLAIVVVAACVLLLAAIAGACGGGDKAIGTPTPANDSSVVDLTMDAERNGKTIKFSGTTNLPDGAVISYQASTELDSPTMWGKDGTVKVRGGKYSGSIGGAPNEPIQMWVGFQIFEGLNPPQPDEVIERFGRTGEKMEGDTVVDFDEAEGRHAEIVVVVD